MNERKVVAGTGERGDNCVVGHIEEAIRPTKQACEEKVQDETAEIRQKTRQAVLERTSERSAVIKVVLYRQSPQGLGRQERGTDGLDQLGGIRRRWLGRFKPDLWS